MSDSYEFMGDTDIAVVSMHNEIFYSRPTKSYVNGVMAVSYTHLTLPTKRIV